MKLLINVFLVFIIQNKAFALCEFDLNTNSINESVSSINTESVQTLTISRPIRTNASNCAYAYYFFSKGNANSYNRRAFNTFGESLNYNLYSGTSQFGILKDAFDFQNANEYIRTYLQRPDENFQSQFYFYLPGSNNSSMVRGGSYSDQININVYRSGMNSAYAYYEFTRILPITIFVPKSVNISLVDTGSPIDLNSTFKNLDFGNLETNESKSFDLMVASNAGFRISLSSLNNGKLKNNLNANYTINYSLTLNGNVVNLSNSSSSPITVATGSGVTGNNGVRLPFNVKIGTVDEGQWGDYQDYITITAATND